MRALVQRVGFARVTVEERTVGDVGPGLLIFLGVGQGDTKGDAATLAAKIAKLRIFNDDVGKMNRSVREAGNAALVVSQFTLYADTTRGNRPSFASWVRLPPTKPRRSTVTSPNSSERRGSRFKQVASARICRSAS